MILLPTRARPRNLLRFIKAYHNTAASEPVMLMLDDDDSKSYEGIPLPDGWKVVVRPQQSIVKYLNQCFYDMPNEPYYAMLADDVEPLSGGWDKILKGAAGSDFVAWPDDLIQGSRLPTHPFIGGDLARSLHEGVATHFAAGI
jgi:hypothetical protein